MKVFVLYGTCTVPMFDVQYSQYEVQYVLYDRY